MHLRFDRGTILLADPPAGLELTGAPGILWDPRVRAHRAPASAYAALARWLRDRGVRFVDAARVDRALTEGWGEPGLRDYQSAALCAWELASRRGVVVLPTGSGKTRVALAAMASTRLPALCLVPTRVLLEQWRREIAVVYPHPVGCHGDGRRDVTAVTVEPCAVVRTTSAPLTAFTVPAVPARAAPKEPAPRAPITTAEAA